VELRRSAYCFLNPTAVRTSVYASPGGVPRGTSGLRPSRAVEPHEGRASAVFDVKRELHEPAAVHLRSWFHVEHGFRLPYRILTPPIILFHGERNRCARTEGAIRRRRVKRMAGEFLAACSFHVEHGRLLVCSRSGSSHPAYVSRGTFEGPRTRARAEI
jgi:hypothetical protein